MRLLYCVNIVVLSVIMTFWSLMVYSDGNKVLKIYLDADRTNHKESALSIEMGIKTAFSEIGNKIQGYHINFVAKDHRGNAVRSKLNMTDFKDDPRGLFILAGLHSPPLIKYRQFINENDILVLVPWAAGGPITRYPNPENWVFRLSIDDTKAGYRMVNYATEVLQCKSPHLLLEKTPWGESNVKTMTSAISKSQKQKPGVSWFNWNTRETGARIKLRKIINSGADCILFVGNAIEGTEFMKALAGLENKVPIISHWGITGGNFHQLVNQKLRNHIDISFIQTCFSFVSSRPTEVSRNAFKKAQLLFPDIRSPIDIPAPTGFIHAYDLGLIVISALNSIKLTGDIKGDRDNLRKALENLEAPINGLVKTYYKPFSIYSEENDSAHEALGVDDFCMAKYGESDEIIVFPN